MRNAREPIFDGAIAGKASPYERLSAEDDRVFDDDAFSESFIEGTNDRYDARFERPAIRALVGEVGGLDVVDVGPPKSDHAAWLRERGARVVELNPAEVDLREALPLPKEAFDLVFSSLTLHYVREWEPLLREFRRITRPSGTLVFSAHHPCRGLHDGLGVDYFSTGLVVDRCSTGGNDVRSRYWRRPLQTIVSSLVDTGWRIAKIVEPRVAEAVDPWFVIVRATC